MEIFENEFSKKVRTIATKKYNENIYVTNFYRNEFKFIFKYIIQKQHRVTYEISVTRKIEIEIVSTKRRTPRNLLPQLSMSYHFHSEKHM